MNELELRFAADVLALLNANRIQLRNEWTAQLSGCVLSGYDLGESGLFGAMHSSQWTNFRWEFSPNWYDEAESSIASTVPYNATAEFRSYVDTIERVLNTEDENSILHYAAMSTPYTLELELSDPESRMILGTVAYDGVAKQYVFTAACEMVNVP